MVLTQQSKFAYRFFLIVFCVQLFGYQPKRLFAQNSDWFRYSIQKKQGSAPLEKTHLQLLGILTSGNESLQTEWQTAFAIPYSLSVERQSYDDHKLKLQLFEPQISGQKAYREFPLNQLLLPDMVSGWYKQSPTERIVFKKTLAGIPAAIELTKILPASASYAEGAIDGFGYSEQKIESLLEATTQINQYWALSHYINRLSESISAEENTSADNVAAVFSRREQIRKALVLLRQTAQMDLLEHSGVDPADLWKQSANLQRSLTRYNTLLEQLVSGKEQTPELFKQLAAKYRLDMVKSLGAALRGDFRDHELLLKTGRLLPDTNFYQPSKLFERGINAPPLAEIIALEVVSLADSLHQASDFSNAYVYYEDAQKVFLAIGQNPAAGDVKTRAEASRLGLLRSYLQISSKALAAGNKELAWSYQQKSKDFIQKNPQNGLVNRIATESNELLKTYLNKAGSLTDQKQFTQAIALLEEALNLTQTYYNLNYQEQINQALFVAYRQVYLDLVNQAKAYYLAGEMNEAERRLNYAFDYQKDHATFLQTSTEAFYLQNEMMNRRQYETSQGLNRGRQGLAPESDLDALENAIVQMVEEARLKVWANEMEDAWRLYEKAAGLSKKNFLEKRSRIKEAFRQLDQSMIERICLNHRFRVEELTETAKKMIAFKEFSSLEATVKEIIRLEAENQGCGLQADQAKKWKVEYEDLFRYYNDFQDVTALLFSSGFEAVIPQYLYFDKQISQYRLERFGVVHLSLFDFVRSQHNPTYTLRALAYHLSRMDTLETAQYVQLLGSQNFDWISASELLQKAASLLAVSDFEMGIGQPEQRIYSLIGHDKRFDVFKKTYLSSMKQLAKQSKAKSKQNPQ